MASDRKSARDLSAEFSEAARRQRPHPPDAADEREEPQPSPGLASIAATDTAADFSGGQPYTRLYVSWDAAERLDTEHRALRRRLRGRVSKLQLLDALLTVAFRHPEEVLTELKARKQPGTGE